MPIDCSVEKVDLFLAGKQLPKLHTFNLTDAFAVVYSVDSLTKALTKAGTTELIRDSQNPVWATAIHVDYMFEIVQEIVVKVFQNKDSNSLQQENSHELIGEVRLEIGRLMRSTNQKLNLLLQGSHAGDGSIDVRAEAVVNTRDVFKVSFSANKLTNKDGFFGTSDPFFTIGRMNEDGSHTLVYTSPRIDNSLNPRWGEIKLPMATLCNNDLHRPLRIELLDWDSNGKHQSMGIVNTSVHGMLSANNSPLEVKEKKKGGEGKGAGQLVAGNACIEHHPTFTEFLASGLQISLVVAVDYTGSNGDPSLPSSLHFLDSSHSRDNPYQQGIRYVGRVLEPYDSDHRYSLFGFGARVLQPDSGEYSTVQHCIPVARDAQGIDGLLSAYEQSISTLMMSGPTLFSPLLETIQRQVGLDGCTPDRLRYTVLLILTDGSINDMDETVNSLISASQQPMSVVIVGVGPADFSLMHELDADKGLLRRPGRMAERDIVQFVALQENLTKGMPVVAQQVLAEIPTQVLQYMEKRGITPAARR